MRVFMAEHPDYLKEGLKQDFQAAGYNLYDPAFAKTNDTDSLAQNLNLAFPHNYYATENYSKPVQRHPRFTRNVDDNRSYDDLNDRAEGPNIVANPYPVASPTKSALKKERAVTSRPDTKPYSLLAKAGSMHLNYVDPTNIPRNPIAGYSEGEA